MNNRSKGIKNLIYSILSQIITIGFGLLLPRLFVVGYGSEVNGLLSSLQQFLVYLSLFEAGVGFAVTQALYRPVAEEDWDAVNGVMSATGHYYRQTGRWYFYALVALSILYPLLVECSLPFWTVCGAVFFSGIGNVASYYLQGKYRCFLQVDGKDYLISNLNTVTHVLVSLSKVVLIMWGVNIVVILAAAFVINCLPIAYVLWYVHRHYPRMQETVEPNFQAISQKHYALGHQISSLIFKNTDVLILTLFCDLRVVSVYTMFKLVTNNLENVLHTFINSIRFHLGQTYQTDKPRYIRMIDIVESYCGAIIYAVFAVTLFLFLPFMRLYMAGVTDANYVDGKLAVLFVAISLLDLSRSPMLETINYAGHYRQTLPRSVLESAINLTVSLVGVYVWGIYGVLLGTVVALVYRTNDIILYANHKLLDRSARRTYTIYLLNIVLFLLMRVVFGRVFGGVAIDSYLDFAVVGFFATVLALAVFVGAQTLAFGHCRSFAKAALKKWRGKAA